MSPQKKPLIAKSRKRRESGLRPISARQFRYARNNVPAGLLARARLCLLNMKQQEIAEIFRKEIGELEVCIKKTQARCDRLKRFVIALEDELNPSREEPKSILDGKFREVIDKVFGEKPKRPKQRTRDK
jgi:hypothetical protein